MEKEFRIDVDDVRIGNDRKIIVMNAQSDGLEIILACKSIQAHCEYGTVEDHFLLECNEKTGGNLEVNSVDQTALLFLEYGHFDIVYDYIDFVE